MGIKAEMNNDESEKFKIDFETPGTEDIPIASGITDIRRSKIPAFALFLAFIAMFGFIFFVYLNLGTRINAITKAGETRIKTVSSGVEDRLETVSKKMNVLKKDMETKVSTLATNEKKDKEDIHALSKKLTRLSKTLKDITRGHARTRKEVSALGTLLEKVKTASNQTSADLKKRLKTVETEIKDLAGAQADALSELRDQLDVLSKQVDDLAAASIDRERLKEAVDAAVAAMNKTITQRMDEADARYARELSAVKSKISRINSSVSTDSHPKPTGSAPQKVKPPKVQAPVQPSSDGIIEQEIK